MGRVSKAQYLNILSHHLQTGREIHAKKKKSSKATKRIRKRQLNIILNEKKERKNA